MPAEPLSNPGLLAGRLMIGMGVMAFVLAALAVLFGEQVKPMGEIADGLLLWQLMAICLAFIGVTDTAIGAYMVRKARNSVAEANPGPKR
jgi:hypothetical protein